MKKNYLGANKYGDGRRKRVIGRSLQKEVGTAKTVKRYISNPNGAVYGFAQTPERVRTEVSNPLKNLSFASAWTKTGGGYSGAIYSGYFCAQNVLRKWR